MHKFFLLLYHNFLFLWRAHLPFAQEFRPFALKFFPLVCYEEPLAFKLFPSASEKDMILCRRLERKKEEPLRKADYETEGRKSWK